MLERELTDVLAERALVDLSHTEQILNEEV